MRNLGQTGETLTHEGLDKNLQQSYNLTAWSFDAGGLRPSPTVWEEESQLIGGGGRGEDVTKSPWETNESKTPKRKVKEGRRVCYHTYGGRGWKRKFFLPVCISTWRGVSEGEGEGKNIGTAA